MSFTKVIPESIKDYISNAKYYLGAARELPFHTHNAARILLLLVAWENIVIADKELDSWAFKTPANDKLYKDHLFKFTDAPEIYRVVLGKKGTKAQEKKFSTAKDLTDLRIACQYGTNTESKNVAEIFRTGWIPDDFERKLESKIKWTEGAMQIFLF